MARARATSRSPGPHTLARPRTAAARTCPVRCGSKIKCLKINKNTLNVSITLLCLAGPRTAAARTWPVPQAARALRHCTPRLTWMMVSPTRRDPRPVPQATNQPRVNGARAESGSTEPAPYPSQRSPRRIRVNGARAESESTEPAPNPGQRSPRRIRVNGTVQLLTAHAGRGQSLSLESGVPDGRALPSPVDGPCQSTAGPLPVDGRAPACRRQSPCLSTAEPLPVDGRAPACRRQGQTDSDSERQATPSPAAADSDRRIRPRPMTVTGCRDQLP